MQELRYSILQKQFPAFVGHFMKEMYPKGNYPSWAVDAFSSVGIKLQVEEESLEETIAPKKKKE